MNGQVTTLIELEGHTLTDVQAEGDRLIFTRSDGARVLMYHEQDCCESVYIEDIIGDLSDLVGSPIIVAEERYETGTEEDEWGCEDSFTATFYTLRTIKGTVDIRWYGTSNGYYSESVGVELEY